MSPIDNTMASFSGRSRSLRLLFAPSIQSFLLLCVRNKFPTLYCDDVGQCLQRWLGLDPEESEVFKSP